MRDFVFISPRCSKIIVIHIINVTLYTVYNLMCKRFYISSVVAIYSIK